MSVTAVRGWLRRRLLAVEAAIFETSDARRRAEGLIVTRPAPWRRRYQHPSLTAANRCSIGRGVAWTRQEVTV